MKRAAWLPAAGVLAAVLNAQAATYNYTAGGEIKNYWSDRFNWENNILPSFNNEADLVFDTNLSVNNLRIGSDRIVRSLTFGPDVYGLNGDAVIIETRNDAGTLVAHNLFLNGGSGNAAITSEAGHGNAIIRVGANTQGFVSLQTDLDLTVNHPTSLFQFDGRVFGVGHTIHKYGVGAASVTRANGFGGLVIHQGTFKVFSNANAGGNGSGATGNLAVGGAGGATDAVLEVGTTVTRTNAIAVNSGDGARTIRNMDAGVAAGVGNPTLEGAITLDKDVNLDVGSYAAGTHDRITLGGAIGGEGGVVKTGSGLLVLSGTNTYSGTTTVNAGTLVLAGSETINDLARLVLGADTAFTMEFEGVETVEGLSLDGGATWLPNGTYDAAALGGLGSGTYGGGGSIKVQSLTTQIGPVAIQALGSTAVVLEWGSEVGFSYGIEGKTDLVFGDWEPVASNFAGTGGFLGFTGSVSEAKAYYRIVLE